MRYEPFILSLLTASLVMLGGCGGDSESEYLRQLSGNGGQTRQGAAEWLGKAGSWRSVQPLLATLATDGKSGSQLESACLEALRAIFSREPSAVLREIGAAFGDDESSIRAAACSVWASLGSEALGFSAEVAALFERDRDLEVRRQALQALVRAGAPEATKAVAQALCVPSLRDLAVDCAIDMGPGAGAVVEAFLEDLRERERELVYFSSDPSVWRALGRIGPLAVPAIAEFLRGERLDPKHVVFCCRALAEVGREAGPAVPALVDVLGKTWGGEWLAHAEAIRTLGAVGAPAAAALAAIQRELEICSSFEFCPRERLDASAPRRIVLDWASSTLGRPLTTDPELISSWLCSADLYCRWAAVEAAPEAFKAAEPELVERLCAILGDENENLLVRRSAAEALGKLGKTTSAGVPALVAAMKDRALNPLIRGAAAEALGKVDEDGASLVDLLGVFQEQTEHWWVRGAAMDAIASLGPKAVPVLDKLLLLVEDSSYEDVDRRDAVSAIGAMGPAAQSATQRLVQRMWQELRERPQQLEEEGHHVSCGNVVPWAVAEVLPSLGRSGLEHLLGALFDEDPEVVSVAMFGLGCYGEAAAEAVPALELLKGHHDPKVREDARCALGHITGSDEVLGEELSNDEEELPEDPGEDE